MSKSNFFEGAVLNQILNGVAIPGLGATLYVSLHTADPGEAGTQSTNEVSYAEYARVALDRDDTDWVVTGSSASPAANVSFPASTGAGGTATFFGVGLDASGAGPLLYRGTIAPTIAIENGTTPILSTATTITEE